MRLRIYLMLTVCFVTSLVTVFAVQSIFQLSEQALLKLLQQEYKEIALGVSELNWKSEQDIAKSLAVIDRYPGVVVQKIVKRDLSASSSLIEVQPNAPGWTFYFPVGSSEVYLLQMSYSGQASDLSDHSFIEWPAYLWGGLSLLGFVLIFILLWPRILLENHIKLLFSDDGDGSDQRKQPKGLFQSEKQLFEMIQKYLNNKDLQINLTNQLRQQSLNDSLTGLGNREYFDAELEIQLKNNIQSINGAVVLFSFEPLMDSYYENKPHFNDRMQQIGDYFARFVNETDLSWVARHDTVDFSILLMEQAPEKVIRVVNQVIYDLERTVFDVAPLKYNFVSAGGVYFVSSEDAYQLLSSADMALRHAQHEGANRFHLYTPKNLPKNQVKGSVRWRSFLQNILDKNKVYLTFQRIHWVNQNKEIRREALARIEQNGEIITAAVFMPMAERAGLARQYDRLIIENIISKLTDTRNSIKDCVWSVNLFAESLLDKAFFVWFYAMIEERQDLIEHLVFEISEFTVSLNLNSFKEPVNQLTALGCRFCVERVGNPNANLDYLKELKIESIKLSQSIIRQLEKQNEVDAFIKSLVATAHQERILVLAEGIEKESEWLLLKQFGVDGAQGYYFPNE